MTLDALLGLLDSVRARGTSKWSARCPSHADNTPSLSIGEGARGLLLHCWAGCTITEITDAIGLKPSDLFYDAGLPRHQRPISIQPRRVDPVALAFRVELGALDRRLRAEAVLTKLTDVDITTVSDVVLDRLLAVAAKVHNDLDRAAELDDVADHLRVRAHSVKDTAS